MSDSKPKNFSRNVLSNYLGSGVSVVVAFLTTPLLTHSLGIVKFGVWALIGSLIPYFELLELGFANATVTYVARHAESGSDDRLRRTLNTSFFVLMGPGAIAAGLAVVVAVFLPHIVHTIPTHLMGQARVLLLLLAFDMAVSIPMDTFGGALIALQRYDLLNGSLITVMVLQAIAWIVLLEMHRGLVALGVATVAISLCGQFSRFLLLRRLVPRLAVSIRSFDRTILRSFATLSGWFSLSEISAAVVGGVDVIVVGIVVGVRAAAIYTVGQRLGTVPGKVLTPPTDVLFPYAGQLAGRGDRKGMDEATRHFTRVAMAIAGPTCMAVALLASPAVRAWVGPSYHEAAKVAVILAISVLFQALAVAPRTVMSGSGRPKVPTAVSAAEALVHVGAGIVLCRMYGLIGAAFATLACGVLLEAMVLLPILYRKLGTDALPFLFRLGKAHGIPAVVAGVAGWALARWQVVPFVDHHGRPAGIAVVVAAGLAVVVPYWAILMFTGMTANERALRVARLQDRWGRGSPA